MKYKAVIADVDGTLIEPSSVPILKVSLKLQKAVGSLHKKGIHFGLATGRSLDWVDGLLEPLKIDSPIILDNGAKIYDCLNKKYLREFYLAENLFRDVMETLQDFNDIIYFVNDSQRSVYEINKKHIIDKVSKIMILHVAPDKAEKIYQILIKNSQISVTKSISKHNPIAESIHITHLKAKKEIGLEFVASFLHLKLDEIIGIGDSYNDLDFLSRCGLKIAMGNAVPEVKKIADYIVSPYDKDGVAEAIERFILH